MSDKPSAAPNMEKYFFRASASDFKKIPGSPIAYWVGAFAIKAFEAGRYISSRCSTRKGMATGLNAVFVRSWGEVSIRSIGFNLSRHGAVESQLKWFPYANGGNYRKWYGNYEDIVNWENDGELLKTVQHESGRVRAVNINLEFIFKQGLSWTSITSASFSIRYLPKGFLFSSASNALFSEDDTIIYLGILNSKIHDTLGKAINPTLNANPGDIGKIPLPAIGVEPPKPIHDCLKLSKSDWDSYETSWNFACLPLIQVARGEWPENNKEEPIQKPAPNQRPLTSKLSEAYAKLRQHWQAMTLEMQRLEEENNRIFIEAYGLQDELTPDVPLDEITLTCNPHYRYSKNKSLDELEKLLLADTMRELISYALGCMFGRYSLDQPGLILANQGETREDYLKQVPEPSFEPEQSNVLPILEGNWFKNDIVERFGKFLKTAFGEEQYVHNLQFIENSLNLKDKKNYTLRDYFVGEFYTDHIKRYKKRPIYWLFSSPKGTFNALIYMHRYRQDTVSIVLNDYLREFISKLAAQKQQYERTTISENTSASEKTKATKEIEKLNKNIHELEEYERQLLYPLAVQKLEINLDDGVKINYPKFGMALKKIPGLEVSDD